MSNNFDYLNEIGKGAESIIKEKLEMNGFEVKDVSDDKRYQKVDIDLVASKQGTSITVEIKHDSKISVNGNFFFENSHERESGVKEGWLHKCKAQALVFVDSSTNTIYLLDWFRTKQYVLKYGRYVEFYNKSDRCRSSAYVVPVQDIRVFGLLIKEIRLN